MQGPMAVEEFCAGLAEARKDSDRPYVFFLGAGCSVTSGIPTAGTLVKDHWLPKLHSRFGQSGKDFAVWVKDAFPTYASGTPAAIFGDVAAKLFPKPAQRQREIERLCEGAFPGFGYAVLALLASNSPSFNVILTTNFDDLIADAFYLYTEKRPLVIADELLADYIQPTRTRPLIVKLHGDNRLTPKLTREGTAALAGDLEDRIRDVLHGDRGLIFVGYGGYDEGILKMLAKLSPNSLRFGVFWVSGKKPSGRPICSFLEKHEATWVEMSDFDELMLLTHTACSLPHPDIHRLDRVFRRYATELVSLEERGRARPVGPGAPDLRPAARAANESFRGPWLIIRSAETRALASVEEADRIYVQGVRDYPAFAPLLGSYALFLKNFKKDYDSAEGYYNRAIEADPNDGVNIGNYAVFLDSVRRKPDQAEKLFSQALALDQYHPGTLGNYAAFLSRRDPDRAEGYYTRAIAADPTFVLRDVDTEAEQAEGRHQRRVDAGPIQTNNLGNYALFLDEVRRDPDRAEEYYLRAIEADPNRADNLRIYAVFLETVKEDFDNAEEYYLRAMAADPKHARSIGNYASFLQTVRKNFDKAEECYKRAIEAGPNHARDLGNYAVFLKSGRTDFDRAEEYYKRAIEADPKLAGNLGNYAVFLETVRKDFDRAEEYYKRAIEADPKHALNLGNYADFLEKVRKDFDKAEEYYKRAIEADPKNTWNLRHYANFLEKVRKDPTKAEELRRQAGAVDS